MNTYPDLPFDLHWDSQQLADAVPLKIHELSAFDVDAGASGTNDDRFGRKTQRQWRCGYLRNDPPTFLFRVHN